MIDQRDAEKRIAPGSGLACDGIFDRVACAFASCTSHDIRSTIGHVLTEIATACGAQSAVLMERGTTLFHIAVNAPPGHAAVGPDDAWLRGVTGGCVPASIVPAQDWEDRGGTVLVHPFSSGESGSVLALRWDAPGPRCGEGPVEQDAGRVTEMIRRIGTVIEASLQREDLAEERRALLRRLSESQNLDIASATAVALAHNLNNILAAMLGHTEVALEALRNLPRGYDAVIAIRNASERAAELIESILGFGQRDVPPAPVSMARLAAETLELIRPAVPDRITLSCDDATGGQQTLVFGRAAELQQVLFNLLRNAVQATPGEGQVALSLTQRQGDERLTMQLGALTTRPYVVVAVRDDGIGIEPELRATIFRPFYTTRPAGTGLGLSAVADIVGEHEGAIRVFSSGRSGTTFEIWFPQSGPNAQDLVLARGVGQPVVLVAPLSIREHFEDIIAALGYEPDGYETIEEALETLLATPYPPHALVLCTSSGDLDRCIVAAERFRVVTRSVPMTIAVPGRMSATPLGRIAGRQTWLAGADNNSAIAACMRLMADAGHVSTRGATR
ncbi:hypothetical protein AA103196_1580 [Ameyamaea chiangmaiensis NBRC 103196]|uniref:histidine kinase n=1 Tax=Ameyamaea chiangmaiensis TaxID=442969 RepID=A0A850PAU9_9PROT|nr:ATP-binding protein [Ameyamaea chiangmaiensis]MBS4076105.1 hypothetical protein [Ameyamaea chiangmaiensis]NVN41675.1 hypothetical protein [Ameyamaea chiangmaiensis]GBQ67035.1 hypothetical protein AA103196_1580 [Ameyamaea chiangmaiensis NBRC 103196]